MHNVLTLRHAKLPKQQTKSQQLSALSPRLQPQASSARNTHVEPLQSVSKLLETEPSGIIGILSQWRTACQVKTAQKKRTLKGMRCYHHLIDGLDHRGERWNYSTRCEHSASHSACMGSSLRLSSHCAKLMRRGSSVFIVFLAF